MLWTDLDAEPARANLRKALSRLRAALPDSARGAVELDVDGVAVSAGAVDLDVTRFEALAADATPASLERAVGLYGGPLLEGLGDCGEAFEGWLRGERQRLGETARHVVRRLLDHYVGTGAIDRAIQAALRALAGRWAEHLRSEPDAELRDVCFTANTARSGWAHRAAWVVDTAEQAAEALAAYGAGRAVAGTVEGRTSRRPTVAFLFPGQGSPYAGMGSGLY